MQCGVWTKLAYSAYTNLTLAFLKSLPVALPAEYVTLFAGAVVALGEVMAVLGAVTVVMAVGALVLLWTMKERPAAVS